MGRADIAADIRRRAAVKPRDLGSLPEYPVAWAGGKDAASARGAVSEWKKGARLDRFEVGEGSPPVEADRSRTAIRGSARTRSSS